MQHLYTLAAERGDGIPILLYSRPDARFAEGGLVHAAEHIRQHGRWGDEILLHVNPEEFATLKGMWGEPTLNPHTGLPEYGFLSHLWKQVKHAVKKVVSSPLFQIAAPLALNFFAPGLGVALGSMLGASGAAAGTVGRAVIGGALGALGGGGTRGALMGAVSGGLAGSGAAGRLGSVMKMPGFGGQIAGNALLSGGLSSLGGGNFMQGATSGALGAMAAPKIAGLFKQGMQGFGFRPPGAPTESAGPMTAMDYTNPTEGDFGVEQPGPWEEGYQFPDSSQDMNFIDPTTPTQLSPAEQTSGFANLAKKYLPVAGVALGLGAMGSAAQPYQPGAPPPPPPEKPLPTASYDRQVVDLDDPSSYYTYGTTGGEHNWFTQNSLPTLGDSAPVPGGPPPSSIPGYTPPPAMPGSNPGKYTRSGFAEGGAGALAYVRGPGSGRSDDIDAKLSDGEYVIDAETVALLGDGSLDEGARRLDEMRKRLRMDKGAALAKGKFSPPAKPPEAYMAAGGKVGGLTKGEKVLKHIMEKGYLEDRMEYEVEDLQRAYPELSADEAKNLKDMIDRIARDPSIEEWFRKKADVKGNGSEEDAIKQQFDDGDITLDEAEETLRDLGWDDHQIEDFLDVDLSSDDPRGSPSPPLGEDSSLDPSYNPDADPRSGGPDDPNIDDYQGIRSRRNKDSQGRDMYDANGDPNPEWGMDLDSNDPNNQDPFTDHEDDEPADLDGGLAAGGKVGGLTKGEKVLKDMLEEGHLDRVGAPLPEDIQEIYEVSQQEAESIHDMARRIMDDPKMLDWFKKKAGITEKQDYSPELDDLQNTQNSSPVKKKSRAQIMKEYLTNQADGEDVYQDLQHQGDMHHDDAQEWLYDAEEYMVVPKDGNDPYFPPDALDQAKRDHPDWFDEGSTPQSDISTEDNFAGGGKVGALKRLTKAEKVFQEELSWHLDDQDSWEDFIRSGQDDPEHLRHDDLLHGPAGDEYDALTPAEQKSVLDMWKQYAHSQDIRDWFNTRANEDLMEQNKQERQIKDRMPEPGRARGGRIRAVKGAMSQISLDDLKKQIDELQSQLVDPYGGDQTLREKLDQLKRKYRFTQRTLDDEENE